MANPEALRDLLERGDERTRYIQRILTAWREGFAHGRKAGWREGYAQAETDREAEWHRIARPVARPEAHARGVSVRNLRAAEAESRRDADEHEQAFIARSWATPAHLRTEVQNAVVHSCPPPQSAARPLSGWPVPDMCRCGRPLLTWAGDLDPTCTGCRSTSYSCDCPKTGTAKAPRAVRTLQLPPPGAMASDPLPDEPWTELGYAHRLAEVYSGRMRYVHAWKRWLVWDGKRWAHDQTGQAQRWAKLTARTMTDVVLASDDPAFVRDYYPVARKGETSAAVTSVLNLASSDERIATAHADLDADPFLLNCANGVLDLRTGELGPHDPALLLTKMTGAAYEPEAPCPVFTQFLAKVQPGAQMRSFLARLLGHALEGRVIEHILPIFCGAGKNGKSTLTTAVVAALGDYAGPADPELLTARSFDAHPTSVADLCGMRLARIDETNQGRRLGEGTVKRLTGGDRVKARRMREDWWSFDPTHTFLMLTNHKPVITGTDEGIWRRIRLVPWDVVIPAEEQDGELGSRLALELDAILAWLVAGHADWKTRGLGEPENVALATAAYRNESDALARFLAERCMSHGQVKSSDLFAAWHKWCAAESEEAGTQTAFSNELTNRGYDKVRENTGMFWKGLGLSEE